MRSIRAWLVRFGGLFSGAAKDDDLAAELESHLQLHVADSIRGGMTPEAARRHALLALGGVEATKERYRDRRGVPLLDTLRQDLMYALRVLRKNPGFAATAIVTLALGIGANTAIFSIVNAVLLRPLPFSDPDRLVLIFATDARRGDRFDSASYPAFADWRDQTTTFESMAAFANRPMAIGTGDETVMAAGRRVTPNYFDVLGVQPALGRAFRLEEQQNGSAAVILSHGFWKTRFGGDPGVLGRVIRINDEPHTVIGVTPASFHIEQDGDQLFLPLAIDPNRSHGFLHVIGRLRPGATLSQARVDLERIAVQQTRLYPRQHTGVGVNLMSMNAGLARDVRFGLLTMLGVVGIVLLITCANVAGLMLARGTARQRELAVRAALGAGRTRLVRQLLTESLLIALVGGAVGLLAADWTAHGLASILATRFRVARADAAGVDGTVLLFMLVVSLVTGALFGVLPALAAASPDLNDALRESGRSATGLRAPRLRQGLVVLETALALVLLAGAGTLLKTFLTLRTTHPGFEPSHVLALDLFLPQPRFAERNDRVRFFDDALRRIHALPGVRSAAFVADLPLGGSTDSESFHIVGRPDPSPDRGFSAGFNIVSAHYFQLMRIPIRSGREFLDVDGPATPNIAIVNETAAKRFWPGRSPLGEQIDLPITRTQSMLLTIVGVAADVRHVGLGTPPRAELFLNSMQSMLPWPWLVLAVRADGDPSALAEPVKATLRAVNPHVPIQHVNTLDAVVSRSILEPQVYTFLLGAFAALSVVLAAVGLYGLMAYGVTQRTRELGVRVALGAGTTDIVGLVIGEGMRLALAGAGVGLVAAVATTRLLVGLVKGIEPNDPLTFAVVTSVLLASTLLASYLPARRAARVDPMTALRAE
jgi:putative ABC transport system permease protein